MRSSKVTRGVLAVLAGAWMVMSPASTTAALAQSPWPFQLEWTQESPASYYQLCVNGACTVLSDAHAAGPNTWRASLPMFPPGEYRLVLEACGASQCLPGTPDLVIRVLEPSPRRPPIDVVEGPRIPLSR